VVREIVIFSLKYDGRIDLQQALAVGVALFNPPKLHPRDPLLGIPECGQEVRILVQLLPRQTADLADVVCSMSSKFEGKRGII
jgi:hypothetical protein